MHWNKNNDKIHKLFDMAREDPKYAALYREYLSYETAFSNLSRDMPEEDQNILWGFICTSDDMNWRMLEMICERFPIDL